MEWKTVDPALCDPYHATYRDCVLVPEEMENRRRKARRRR
jgi:hypothetical protein